MLPFYARYKASLQRLIYRMSIAGQRQKYYVRIQSIGTARNLYTVLTLEQKIIFGRIQIKKDGTKCNGLLVKKYSTVITVNVGKHKKLF